MGNARLMDLTYERALAAPSNEATLVAELCTGSEDAFAYLLAVYQNPVFNLVAHILNNDADAADVLQNVFVKIFKGVRHFHGESSLKTWIYRIAVHEALNHRRSWRRRLFHEPVSMDDPGEDSMLVLNGSDHGANAPDRLMERAETKDIVRRALSTLAAPYRTVVILREMEDLSYEEIATVTGIAEGTVKSRLRRGRELLRRKLQGLVGV
jgi:RNA polymerase sigma-70 factor, ECF subfamily